MHSAILPNPSDPSGGFIIRQASSNFRFAIKDMAGIFAMWAVRMSPYTAPIALGSAVEHFDTELRKTIGSPLQPYINSWNSEIIQGISGADLRMAVAGIILDIDFVQAREWGKPLQVYPQVPQNAATLTPSNSDQQFICLPILAEKVFQEIWQEGNKNTVFQ